MNPRFMVAAVLVLLVLIGGTFLLIGILEHGDAGDGSNPTKGTARLAVVPNVRR